MADALVLQDLRADARLGFQQRGVRTEDEAERTVLERWARALALGASADGPPDEERLVRGASLRERTERTELAHALAPEVIEHATSVVAPRDFVLLVSDADGVVVRTIGGGAFEDEARRMRLIEGADWTESSRGTNAIGTAIAEKRPVFVHGHAHYARKFHDLVCYAAPIFDVDGALLGILDATSRFASADPLVGRAVVQAARAIEDAIRVRAYASAGATVTRTLARALDRMSAAAVLVEPPGRVARMNGAARVLLDGGASREVSQLLGASYADLARAARSEMDLPFGASARLRVEPIDGIDGRAIALLVFVEPISSAGAVRSPATKSPSPEADAFARVFSEDATLNRAIAWARRIAPSTIPVMLLAETGGGKELVARAIHAASPRARGPFRAINCGSLAPSLLESELFGYGPAAFTGAERRGREGLFAAAAGGTLFLDEVAEMPPAMQASLLRVLEDGTYQRVGETTTRRADVRIVCATCRDLDALVASGAFRKDLYFRLKGARVELPPLRARTDVVALARHVLAALASERDLVPAPRLSRPVEALLRTYTWPGNVRELRTALEVALVMAGDAVEITPAHLPPELAALEPAPATSGLAAVEGSAIRRTLAEVAGNVSLAAKRLGIARSTLYRMMRRHGLEAPE